MSERLPTILFEKRLTRSRQASVLVPVLSFILALIFGGIILLLFGINPLEAYQVMVMGSLGSWPGAASLQRSSPCFSAIMCQASCSSP